MLSSGVKLALVIVAIGLAILLIFRHFPIGDGTGTVIATLAAAAGWLIKDINEESLKAGNIRQMYLVSAEILQRQFAEAFADTRIAYFRTLAPGIADGSIPETPVDGSYVVSLDRLPDIKQCGTLFSQRAIGSLFRWQDATRDLIEAYRILGTKELAAIGERRLDDFFGWVTTSRDRDYPNLCEDLRRDLCETAAFWLSARKLRDYFWG